MQLSTYFVLLSSGKVQIHSRHCCHNQMDILVLLCMQPMGTGKTLATIFSSMYIESTVTLVIVPPVTMSAWRDEIRSVQPEAM